MIAKGTWFKNSGFLGHITANNLITVPQYSGASNIVEIEIDYWELMEFGYNV